MPLDLEDSEQQLRSQRPFYLRAQSECIPYIGVGSAVCSLQPNENESVSPKGITQMTHVRTVHNGPVYQKLKIYAISRSELYNIKNKKSLLYLYLNYNSRNEMTVDTILIADRLLVNFKKCKGLFLSQTTLMSSHTVSSPILDAKM